MSAHDKTLAIMKTAAGEGVPFPPKPFGAGPVSTHKRDIPREHPYDPKALKPMAKMLWAMSVSLGHALTAYRQFTRLKSVSISPDGLIGGRGYVMGIKEVRQKLYEACEALSLISDTVHDEINGPHWKPRLALLDKNDAEDVSRFVEESQKNLDNPEEDAEESLAEIEGENDKGPNKTPHEPQENPASKVPGGGESAEANNTFPKQAGLYTQFPVSALALPPDVRAMAAKVAAAYMKANSSIPVETLPGPRVDHLGPGEGQGPAGTYNRNEPPVDDDWSREEGVGNEYAYPSDWDNLTNRTAEHFTEVCLVCASVISQCRCAGPHKVTRYGLCDSCRKDSASSVPDSNTDRTPTEGWDFGIGYGGGNDAHGQGAGGYGVANPDTGEQGVNGPASGLPKNPGGPTHDNAHPDTTRRVEVQVSPNRNVWADAMLPNDDQPPVARSDYYEGPKGGMVGQSEVPGDESVSYNADRDLPNTGQTFERTDNPYIKWDDTTRDYRPDQTYQRTREGSHNG